MEIQLSPDQEAHLAAIAASAGRSTAEIVQEALALWEERLAQLTSQASAPKLTPAQAAARIRERRKYRPMPEGTTIREMIDYGRA